MRRIVLTGGPGAGKTVISRQLALAYPARLLRVPEAATQVYHDLQTRWDKLDIAGRREVQRRIYALQVDQENALDRSHPEHALILDRGTIDGAAYWPDGVDAYWKDLGTDHATELSRYDAVIWLQTSAILGIYDGDASNICRFEDPQAAIRSGQLLEQLWGGHRRFVKVEASEHLDTKSAEVDAIVRALIDGTAVAEALRDP